MALVQVKVDGTIQPFQSAEVDWKIDPPYSFQVEFPSIFDIADGGTVEIWRNGARIFGGRYEKDDLIYDDNGEHFKIGYRDFSQNGYHRRTGGTSYVESTVQTCVRDLVKDCGWTEGTITQPFNVYHRWLQLSQTDFDLNTLNQISVLDTGEAKLNSSTGSMISPLIDPSQLQSWLEFSAEWLKPGITTITFDILDSSNVVIAGYDDIATGDLPKDISAINVGSYPSIKARIDMTATPWISQITGAVLATMYGAAVTRFGHRITVTNKTIYAVSFSMQKVNSPTGDVVAKIRKVSDDSVIQTSNTIDASELAATLTRTGFVFTSPGNINEEVRIDVEYSDGDGGNYIQAAYLAADQVAGYLTTYTGSWSDTAGYDANIQIFDADMPSISTWYVTLNADYINFTTDYDWPTDEVNRFCSNIQGEWGIDSGGTFNLKGTIGTDRSGTLTFKSGVNCGAITVSHEITRQTRDVLVIGAGSGTARVTYAGTVSGGTSAYGSLQATAVRKDLATEDECRTEADSIFTARQNKLETVSFNGYDWAGVEIGDTVGISDPDHTKIDGDYRAKRVRWKYKDYEGETLAYECGKRKRQLRDEFDRIKTQERWLKDQ